MRTPTRWVTTRRVHAHFVRWLDDARILLGFRHTEDALARAIVVDVANKTVTTYAADLGDTVVAFFDREAPGSPHAFFAASSRSGLCLVACNLSRDVGVVREDPEQPGAYYLHEAYDEAALVCQTPCQSMDGDERETLVAGLGVLATGVTRAAPPADPSLPVPPDAPPAALVVLLSTAGLLSCYALADDERPASRVAAAPLPAPAAAAAKPSSNYPPMPTKAPSKLPFGAPAPAPAAAKASGYPPMPTKAPSKLPFGSPAKAPAPAAKPATFGFGSSGRAGGRADVLLRRRGGGEPSFSFAAPAPAPPAPPREIELPADADESAEQIALWGAGARRRGEIELSPDADESAEQVALWGAGARRREINGYPPMPTKAPSKLPFGAPAPAAAAANPPMPTKAPSKLPFGAPAPAPAAKPATFGFGSPAAAPAPAAAKSSYPPMPTKAPSKLPFGAPAPAPAASRRGSTDPARPRRRRKRNSRKAGPCKSRRTRKKPKNGASASRWSRPCARCGKNYRLRRQPSRRN